MPRPPAPHNAKIPPPDPKEYQKKECILFGSIFEKNLIDLENRLAGICDPGYTPFHEHEMSLSLKTSATANPDVTLRLRRKFQPDTMSTEQWRFRYVGRPEPDADCPVVVRKVIHSVSHSKSMMEFVKAMGLRLDFEYVVKGKMWTCGGVKIIVSSIQRTKTPGKYDSDNLEKISDSFLVEVSITLDESTDYHPYAKQLKLFCTQLSPIVEMQKVEYLTK